MASALVVDLPFRQLVAKAFPVVLVALFVAFPRAVLGMGVSFGIVVLKEAMRVVQGIVEPLCHLVQEVDNLLQKIQTAVRPVRAARGHSCLARKDGAAE
jgi:hypothetical protein